MMKSMCLAAGAFLALSLGLAPAAAQAKPPTRAEVPGGKGLQGLVTADDYPAEALKNDEQGTVRFQLDVGRDGKPTGCTVVESSGSKILDDATCRLIVDRARFEPARDRRGRPTTDQVTSRITWRLVEDAHPRVEAAYRLWGACVLGEATKLATGDLPAEEVARRGFQPCAALEALLAKQAEGPEAAARARPEMIRGIAAAVTKMREMLNAPDEPDDTSQN